MAVIGIRADGGNEIGLGHIMRTMVLAKELIKFHQVFYICRVSEANRNRYNEGIKILRNNAFQVYEVEEEYLIENLKKLKKEKNIDCLITDSYDVDEKYFDTVKGLFKFTGYFDDLNCRRINTDFILNQNIYASNLKYNTLPNKNSKLLLGPEYVLLREEFRREENKVIKAKAEDILVTVGGMDKDFNTLKIINMLKDTSLKIHVVIGGAFEDALRNKLKAEAEKSKDIFLYENAKMAELMKRCDMAVSACGSTIYELAALQVPTVGVVVSDNQLRICNTMDEMQVIIGTGKLIYSDELKLKEIIMELINNSEKRNKMAKLSKKLINVNGVKKAVNIINDILLETNR